MQTLNNPGKIIWPDGSESNEKKNPQKREIQKQNKTTPIKNISTLVALQTELNNIL